MNTKNVICGGVAGTIFIFLFDWVVHGMLLVGQYEMYESLWRSASEMESMMGFMVFSQALLAFAMAYFVDRKGIRGWKRGAKFGAMIGTFFAAMAVGNYLFLPLALTLPVLWAVSIFVSMTCVGAIAGWCNK